MYSFGSGKECECIRLEVEKTRMYSFESEKERESIY